MPIYNNAHAGSDIPTLALIDRVLLRRKGNPILREELLRTCCPEHLPENENQAKTLPRDLVFWIEEGLWVEDHAGLRSRGERPTEENLPARVLDCMFARTRIESGPPARIQGRAGDLLMVLACLIAQDRYSAAHRPPEPIASRGSSGTTGVSEACNRFLTELTLNENEAPGVLRFGTFLGLMEPYEPANFIMDPTRAMNLVIDEVFNKQPELAAKDFVNRVGERLPILDGGTIRNLVQDEMSTQGWNPPRENRLSASLSLGIHRLRVGGRIQLEQLSDDPHALSLALPGGEVSFSRVRLHGGRR